jgi:hypothetical protein
MLKNLSVVIVMLWQANGVMVKAKNALYYLEEHLRKFGPTHPNLLV